MQTKQDAIKDLAAHVRASVGKAGIYSRDGAGVHARNVCRLLSSTKRNGDLISHYDNNKLIILDELLSRLEILVSSFVVMQIKKE